MPESRTPPSLSERLRLLLVDLRQHPAFPELIKRLEPNSRLPGWKPSADAESLYHDYIYKSGQTKAYSDVIRLLEED